MLRRVATYLLTMQRPAYTFDTDQRYSFEATEVLNGLNSAVSGIRIRVFVEEPFQSPAPLWRLAQATPDSE